MQEFVTVVGEVLQHPYCYKQIPAQELRETFLASGMSPKLADDRVLVLSTYHEHHFPVLQATPDALKQWLHREPTTLRQYVAREKQRWLVEMDS